MTTRSEQLWAKNVPALTAVHRQGPAAWNALLDRVAAKVKGRGSAARASASEAAQTFEHEHKLARTRRFGSRLEDSRFTAVEQDLISKAGWDESPADSHQPLTAAEDLAARAWGER